MTLRGRPPAVPASAIVDEVRLLIARAAGQPCPTLDSMAAQTGTNRTIVKNALRALSDAGDLRIERKPSAHHRFGIQVRKMAVKVGGEWHWTSWLTPRFARDAAGRVMRKPESTRRDEHCEAVIAAGRF